MNVVYVVQYSDNEHPFIDQVYCVTETEQDAIILSEEANTRDGVIQAGYEKVEFISAEDIIAQDKNTTNK